MIKKKNKKYFHSHGILLILFFILLYLICFNSVFAIELSIKKTPPYLLLKSLETNLGQIPHSQISIGTQNIKIALFTGPTMRYPHGVLGDSIEASKIIVKTNDFNLISLSLPDNRVFEDLIPRIIHLNSDQDDKIMVVESDLNLGASLAIYGIVQKELKKIASTPFLGRRNRWLNPIGTGDFNGDGKTDIALVSTPHIGGILRLYNIMEPDLVLFSEYTGVSTHQLGSTELGLGQIVTSTPKDRILLPNQEQTALFLLEWASSGIQKVASVQLPGRINSSLYKSTKNHWRFKLENGDWFELTIE